MPYITSAPEVHQRALAPGDAFLLLASDGVWEWLFNEDAVTAAADAAREGGSPASRVVEAVMAQASAYTSVPVDRIRALHGVQRRQCHDDITVTVVAVSVLGAELLGMTRAAHAVGPPQ